MNRAAVFSGILALGMSMAQSVMADQQHQPVYDQYSLQASAEGEVENPDARAHGGTA